MTDDKQQKIRVYLSLLWVVAMYGVTGLTEAVPPADVPEFYHIVIHTAGYLLLALLVPLFPPTTRRTWLALLGLAVLVGFGQEAIQNLARGRLYFWASLFDLGVDGFGAALGLWARVIWRRRQERAGDYGV